jgi:hypothetical protein
MDSHIDFFLAGGTALVTGAGRGIGFSIARGFAQAGGFVVINELLPPLPRPPPPLFEIAA